METREELLDEIADLSKAYAGLIVKYGQGVRPSYVSTDLAILADRISSAKQKLELLDMDSPCDDWANTYGKGLNK